MEEEPPPIYRGKVVKPSGKLKPPAPTFDDEIASNADIGAVTDAALLTTAAATMTVEVADPSLKNKFRRESLQVNCVPNSNHIQVIFILLLTGSGWVHVRLESSSP